ncbi:Histone H1B [Fasciolopsis buskii]|uniref:Histone H1B n=1 Tax=Fasciolopsis buskii TaxID=27845 RepID=A0A8E0RTN8_9TREM|nr:Histone H1B [Fasciolopsis buski]
MILRLPDCAARIAVLCIFGLQSALALECVVCDSYTDGEICENWDRFSFIRNCSQVSRIDPKKSMSCRKIDETVEGVTTVIRQCSNVVNHDGCIDRVGSKAVRTRHCHCSTDLCNEGAVISRLSLIQTCISSIFLLGLAHLIRL